MRLLLIASLVLNIFLLSAGAALAYGWHANFGLGPRAGWRGRAADALPADRAKAFRAAMRETVLASRPLVREGREARAEAARLFVQPNYDANAIKAALARARTADVTLRGRVEERVVDFSATLPIAQREAMAEELRRGPFRQPIRRRAGADQAAAANASDGSAAAAR
jgi:uncharacterized membrane protein